MRKQKVHIILLLLLFSGFLTRAYSQTQENTILQSWLENEFSLRNQNWSISQCPQTSFLFFANSEGLIEYNGIEFKNNKLPGDMPVRAVSTHKTGKVFTGSFEEYGYWQYNETGKLQYTSLLPLCPMESNDEIWKIYTADEKVFFQSFTTIYIYDFEKVEKIKAPYTMLFLHQVKDDFVVQIINDGLYYFKQNEFIPINGSEIFKNKKIHAIIPYIEDQWLICTDKSGIYIFDGESFSFFDSQATKFLMNYNCNNALQISDTSYAFGSILNGVIISDNKGNIQRNYNTLNGLNNNTVLSLFLDKDEGLWTGLDEGINYIDLLNPFTHYRTRNGNLGTIYTLLVHRNYLYIGTNHGLFRAKTEFSENIFRFGKPEFITGSKGQVWTLELLDNQIICGHNEGTFVVEENKMQQISDVTGGWAYLTHNGYLLAGTYTGIIVFEKDSNGRWVFRNKISNYSEPTRYLEIDYLGYLWASHHQRGIYKIELSEDLYDAVKVDHFPKTNQNNFKVRVSKINNRVVFSTTENIYTYDFVRNQIVKFDALTANIDDYKSAWHIVPHFDNQYWFIKQNKIALFDVSRDFKANKKYEINHENIRLPQRKIQPVAINNQSFLLPNPQHFDVYNINFHQTRKNNSRLNFQTITFYGKKDTLQYFKETPSAKIPWNKNNLLVKFSNASFSENTSKNYQYRIRELEKSWQTTTTDHFTYPEINHGRYTLEIKSNNQDMISLPFIIAKPWYSSNTAIIVYLLAFFALIWAIIKFFRFEINRQKELVAMEVKQNRMEKELDYKSYELMLTMRHLLLKDQILCDLKKQITAIKEQSSKYPVKHIKNIERIIQQGLGTQSVEWENAINNLKLSQQGFFKALKEKYPSLTPNDLRLCSYLRMNFNTKEIAQMLNISTRGVEISRHRLRKKLKLQQDENLVEFLMEQELNLTS
ncbi:MAG: LuxR C-terminal-related transcriptional regulator [Bacteroidota bacterium]